jgi:hypothetical protein
MDESLILVSQAFGPAPCLYRIGFGEWLVSNISRNNARLKILIKNMVL